MEHVITPLLNAFAIENSWREPIATLFSLALFVCIALVIRILGKIINHFIIKKTIQRTVTRWDDIILEHGVFSSIASCITLLILLGVYPAFFPVQGLALTLLSRALVAWLVVLITQLITRTLDAINEIYKDASPEIAKRKPIKGYLQMAKIFLYIVSGVLIITGLLDISAIGILSGFGAMSAVLMLVFKDPIMGFVSSLQLTGNDLVRIGDWIEMPKYSADGDVIDITLQTIRVRNWDMTITSIPIYALISDSFRNWRGMSDAAGRRVKKAIFLDMKTVRFLTEEELNTLEKIPLIREYLLNKRAEIATNNAQLDLAKDDTVSGRRLTNLGTFRAYVLAYLKSHPLVSSEMICMVRYLESTAKGIPMEMYFFSSDKGWVNYEGIQSDIIDHVLSVMGEFGLRVFQDLSSWDMPNTLKD